MNEVEFKNWMQKQSVNLKVQSDIISRVKRLEKELGNIDFDDEYKKDKCKYVFSLFKDMGNNSLMQQLQIKTLPIGKYQLATFKYALKKYILFLESIVLDNE